MTRDQQRRAAAATLRSWIDQMNGGPIVASFSSSWADAFGGYQAALRDVGVLGPNEDIESLLQAPVKCARCGHTEAEHSSDGRRHCKHRSAGLDFICWCAGFKEQER